MARAPLPDNEVERLATLLRCEVLDTPPEQAFDDLTRLAAGICDAPISFISMVDSERQWFKSRIGFDTPETARDIAFCAHTILGDDLLIVPDALADERFADNPLVTAEPHIRFYAGVPLVTAEGHALGTICVVDRVPRTITAEQQDALRALARQVVALLELRRHERLHDAITPLTAVIDNAPVAIFAKDLEGRYLIANRSTAAVVGIEPEALIGRTDAEVFPPEIAVRARADDLLALAEGEIELEERLPRPDGVHTFLTRKFPLLDADGAPYAVCGMASDITERTRAEERNAHLAADVRAAFRNADDARRRLSNVLERVTDGFVALDTDWRYTYVNERGAALLGRRPEELIGKHIWEEFPEGVDQPFYHAYHRAVAEQVPVQIEEYYEPWDRWFENRIYPSPEGLTIFYHEITERKQAEEALARATAERQAALQEAAEATRRAAEVLDRVTDTVVGWDRDWRCTFANQRALAQAGLPAEEVVGHRMADVLPPGAAAGLREWGDRAMETQQPLAYRGTWGSPERFLDIRFYPSPEGLTVMSRDETGRYQAEQRARDLAALLDNSPLWVNLAGTDERILYINPAGRRLIGLPEDADVTQLTAGDLPPAGRREEWEAEVREQVTAHGSWQGRFWLRNFATGAEIPARGLVFALRAPGSDEPTGFGCILRDTTQDDLLEEQMARTERLRSLGLLAGGIAHDFNNLLAVILNYASFVAREGAGNEAVVRDAGQIAAAAESGAALVKQLLTFAGREAVQPRVVDLGAVVGGIEDLLHRTLGGHIGLTIEVGPGLWPVEVDPGRLEQVLVNLAINARDAMPEGGTLTISAGNVEAGNGSSEPPEPGRYVRLTVTDTGCGMSEETRERVFEPFFTTKPKGVGTGLGLATVHGIVTQAGGLVDLQSVPGEGTSVTIILPAVAGPTAESPRETTGEVRRGSGERVLVVEDEAAVRESTRRILADHGYEVEVAADGAEALARFDGGNGTDLVLTDVVMPNLSGPALAAALADRAPGVPVLLMSGFASSGEEADLTDAQRESLLEKPLSEADLLRRVRAALDSSGRSEGAGAP